MLVFGVFFASSTLSLSSVAQDLTVLLLHGVYTEKKVEIYDPTLKLLKSSDWDKLVDQLNKSNSKPQSWRIEAGRDHDLVKSCVKIVEKQDTGAISANDIMGECESNLHGTLQQVRNIVVILPVYEPVYEDATTSRNEQKTYTTWKVTPHILDLRRSNPAWPKPTFESLKEFTFGRQSKDNGDKLMQNLRSTLASGRWQIDNSSNDPECDVTATVAGQTADTFDVFEASKPNEKQIILIFIQGKGWKGHAAPAFCYDISDRTSDVSYVQPLDESNTPKDREGYTLLILKRSLEWDISWKEWLIVPKIYFGSNVKIVDEQEAPPGGDEQREGKRFYSQPFYTSLLGAIEKKLLPYGFSCSGCTDSNQQSSNQPDQQEAQRYRYKVTFEFFRWVRKRTVITQIVEYLGKKEPDRGDILELPMSAGEGKEKELVREMVREYLLHLSEGNEGQGSRN